MWFILHLNPLHIISLERMKLKYFGDVKQDKAFEETCNS